MDAEVSWLEVLQHALVNFLYGFFGGSIISSMIIGQWYLILISYYLFKQIEGKILNRNKYITKLGKNIIYPIPSTLGFILAWYLSTLI